MIFFVTLAGRLRACRTSARAFQSWCGCTPGPPATARAGFTRPPSKSVGSSPSSGPKEGGLPVRSNALDLQLSTIILLMFSISSSQRHHGPQRNLNVPIVNVGTLGFIPPRSATPAGRPARPESETVPSTPATGSRRSIHMCKMSIQISYLALRYAVTFTRLHVAGSHRICCKNYLMRVSAAIIVILDRLS